MKTHRYILIALCLGVCVWSATMIVGVLGLARAQGSFALMGLLEVAAFGGAGLLPLLLIWKADAKYRTVLVAVWALCITYVSLLALNLLRLGFFTTAAFRLALWTAIAVLLVRTLRLSRKNAQPVARANDPAWHVGCGAAFGAKQGRGSSVTFGEIGDAHD